MNELFDEILSCGSCPQIDVITDSNKSIVESHLADVHNGISVTAFIIAKRPEERQWLQDTYEEAKDYLDDNFPTKFLRHFEQCAWELCTFRYLKENNVEIYLPERDAGPDFDTSIGYVECIAVTRGFAANAIPIMQASILREDGTFDSDISFEPVPTNAIKLRISAGMSEKIRKYTGYEAKEWFNQTKPRLIALNWNADGAVMVSDSRNIATNAGLQTLFGTGYPEIIINPQTNQVIDERLSREPVLTNANNSPIGVGYFGKEPGSDESRIDGVIMSSKWPGSYNSANFRAVNNPFTQGIDIEAFNVGLRTHAALDEDGRGISLETFPSS
ncbi:MAG: hypothetical protein ACOH18_00045 [Candidatus Saccharimonadaceae bacterium]